MIRGTPPAGANRSPVEIGDTDGDFIIDAQLLAERFGLPETEMRAYLGKKMVHSVVERGVDADEGTWRLTLRLGNRMWRGVVTREGRILEESTQYAPAGRSVPK